MSKRKRNKAESKNSEKRENKMTRTMTKETIQKLAQETGIQSQWEPVDNCPCPICGYSDSVYGLDDNKTYYCLECTEEFVVLSTGEVITSESDGDNSIYADTDDNCDDFQAANKLAERILSADKGTQKSLPGFQHKPLNSSWLPGQSNTGSSYGTGVTGTVQKYCTHKPSHVIAGRGWGVWAGKKYDVESHAAEFDVILNLTYTPIKERRVIPIPELKHWESYHAAFDEIQIDWPDYGISTLPRKFWDELIAYLSANKKRLLVFCMGGHGRTGTAVATMLVCGLGWDANKAINWVRRNYCDEAIETKSQEAYIRAIARAGKMQDKKANESK